MSAEIEEWLSSAGHLPTVLKDFHDQKAIFRAMHKLVDTPSNEYVEQVDPVIGHAYVVDLFLHFMARRGYTLQRSRYQLPFRDLELDVERANLSRRALMSTASEDVNAVEHPKDQSHFQEESMNDTSNPDIEAILFEEPSGGVRGTVTAFISTDGGRKHIAHATLLVGQAPSVSIVAGKLCLAQAEIAADTLRAFTQKVRELSPEA